MANENRAALRQTITSMPRENEKEIQMHGGAGETGIKVMKLAQWKTKCKSYLNRYYKTSKVIMVPSDGDIIMEALGFLCSDNEGRGFVFKSYDIAEHLAFYDYPKVGAALTSKSIPYIAYVEQKNIIFICEVMNGSNMHHCLENIVSMVKSFLFLYDRKLQGSGVTIIGILIRQNEEQESVECEFCHLFSPAYKLFEQPPKFKNWWNVVQTYERCWKLVNCKMQNKLFHDLAAEILCFMARHVKVLPSLTDEKSEQFKQTYLLFTPKQMEIHFSDAKHIVIQGCYGSGKSTAGLKKVELILGKLV